MANAQRGEVPFTVLGTEHFIRYGTREIAEAQTALGYHRPDPQQADRVVEVDVAVFRDTEQKKPRLDKAGQPVFRKQRVLVNAKERQKRMLEAFDAAVMNPDPEASIVFFRVGLGAWMRETDTKLPEERILQLVDALGLEQLRLLHMSALATGCYLTGDEIEEDRGKDASAAPASST